MRVDRAPAWDPEGKYLYFISTRDFNPVYDALQFDLSFPQATRPFLVTLRSDVANPFVPKPAPIHRDGKDDEKEKDDETPAIRIDFDGITGRIIGFPVEEADYEQIVAAKGRALFTRFPVKGIKPEGRSGEDDRDRRPASLRFRTAAHRDVGEQRFGDALGRRSTDARLRSRERMRVVDAGRELPDRKTTTTRNRPKPIAGPAGSISRARASKSHRATNGRRCTASRGACSANSSGTPPCPTSIGIACSNGTRTCFRSCARAPSSPISSGKCRANSGRRTPTRSAATIVRRRSTGAASSAQTRRGTRRPAAIASTVSCAATRGPHAGFAAGRARRRRARRRRHRRRRREARRRQDAAGRALVNLAGRETSLGIERDGERPPHPGQALRSERMLRYRAWVERNRRDVHETNRRARRLRAHSGHGPVGLLRIPSRLSHRIRPRRADRRRALQSRRSRFAAAARKARAQARRLRRPALRAAVPYPPESVGGPIVALTNQFAGSDGDIFSATASSSTSSGRWSESAPGAE